MIVPRKLATSAGVAVHEKSKLREQPVRLPHRTTKQQGSALQGAPVTVIEDEAVPSFEYVS
jgi:hypothetical protein